jgi:hypothetical protein
MARSYAAGLASWKRKCFSMRPVDQISQGRLVATVILRLGRATECRRGRTVISEWTIGAILSAARSALHVRT